MGGEAYCNKNTTPPEVFVALGSLSDGTTEFVAWCRNTATIEQVEIAYDSLYRTYPIYIQLARDELDRRRLLQKEEIEDNRYHHTTKQNAKTLHWARIAGWVGIATLGVMLAQWIQSCVSSQTPRASIVQTPPPAPMRTPVATTPLPTISTPIPATPASPAPASTPVVTPVPTKAP